MEQATISTFWEIVKDGGGFGVLFVTNVLLWWEFRKKDEKIYSLIEILGKLNQEQIQTNRTLESLSGTLLNLLTKK